MPVFVANPEVMSLRDSQRQPQILHCVQDNIAVVGEMVPDEKRGCIVGYPEIAILPFGGPMPEVWRR